MQFLETVLVMQWVQINRFKIASAHFVNQFIQRSTAVQQSGFSILKNWY